MDSYYEPCIISMKDNDTIDDLIMKLSELGFEEYSLEDIVTLNLDDKILILSQILKEVQDYREHIIIYDNFGSSLACVGKN